MVSQPPYSVAPQQNAGNQQYGTQQGVNYNEPMESQIARISNEEELEDFMLYHDVAEADKAAIRQEWRNEHSTQERGLGAWLIGGAVGGFLLSRLLGGRNRPGACGPARPAWQPGMGRRRSVEMGQGQYNSNGSMMGYGMPYGGQQQFYGAAALPQQQPYYVPPVASPPYAQQAQYGQSGPAYMPPAPSPVQGRMGAGGLLQNLFGKIGA